MTVNYADLLAGKKPVKPSAAPVQQGTDATVNQTQPVNPNEPAYVAAARQQGQGALPPASLSTGTVTENPPKAKPFMAMDTDKYGLPFYGHGFQGWVRKTWADLFDPKKFFQDEDQLSEVEADKIRSMFDKRTEENASILESRLKWSQWGEKFFGLTAEEVATATTVRLAEEAIAEETGQSVAGTNIARAVRLGVDTTQNFIWGGLAILGLDDQLMRKIHTTSIGVDAVADRFDKDDAGDTFVQKLFQNNGVAVAKDVFTIAGAIASGKLTWGDTKETIQKYQAGSEMAYTMMFDEIARAEFERGLAEGKDPEFLAQNLGILSTELVGSILGSPSTYLGLSLIKPVNIFSKAGRAAGEVITFAGKEVKLFGAVQRLPWRTIARIPTFGEIVGLNISKTRIANAALRFTESSIPGLEDVLKKANTVTGEAEAMKVLENAATHTVNQLDDMRKHKKFWNLFSLDNKGKISVTSKDSSLFIQNLVASRGVDEALMVMRDMVLAKRGGKPAIEAAARLMSGNQANMAFSHVGRMTAEIVDRLDQGGIINLVRKYANDPVELHTQLFTKLEGALNDFIPSVDEMLEARRGIKELTGLNKATEITDRMTELAGMADELPEVVKVVNRLTRIPEAVTKKTTAAMAYTFMNLVPRAWTRNITGQAWAIAGQLGFKNAIAISMQALFGLSKKATKGLIDDGTELLAKRLGYIPTSSAQGIGTFTGAAKKGVFSFGMMPAIQRSEQITANKVVLTAASDHILKSLPAVVKDLPEWDNMIKALPQEQQALMFAALKRSYGDFDEAVKLFREWSGNGEIQAWRLTEPSEQMRKHLEQLGVLEDFYTAQRTAKTSDQFREFVEGALKTYEDEVTKSALTMPATLSKMPSELNDFGMDLAKYAPEEQQNVMRGLIQAWQNTLEQLDNTVESVMRSASKKANDITAQTGDQTAFQQVEAIRQKLNTIKNVTKKTYPEINHVREQVNLLVRSVDKMSDAERVKAFKNPVKYRDKVVFDLQKIYPNVDFSTMDAKKMKQLVWTAFFEHSGQTYRNVNTGVFEQSMEHLEAVAKLFGSSLDEIAGSGKGGDSVFNVLARMRSETMKIEEAASWQRFFRQLDFDEAKDPNAMLSDVVGKFESVFPDWKGGQRHIVNAVNKGLGDVEDLPEPQKVKKFIENPENPGGVLWNHRTTPEAAKGISKSGFMLKEPKNGWSEGKGVYLSVGESNAATDPSFGDTVLKTRVQVKKPYVVEPSRESNDKLDEILQGATKQEASEKLSALGYDSLVVKDGKDSFIVVFDPKNVSVATNKIPYEQITLKQALSAIKQRSFVAPYDGGFPTQERTLWEGMDAFKEDVAKWKDAVLNQWDVKVKSLPANIESQLADVKKALKPRMDLVKMEAGIIGESTRNFVLHDYNKTYMDHALTYLLGNSMHYWTTRTYSRAFETILDNPKYANIYMQYKEYNTKRHADLPEWYRQNLQINLPGIDGTNPFFINLEASINPMYGLTGTDFNDPRKRVDWVSRAVDDMNKMGPTFSPLVSWAVAMHLYDVGEEEAGIRWANRLLPQTQIIKSATSAFDDVLEKIGLNPTVDGKRRFETKPVELDPFVNLLSGGVDPYERNRVAAAMAMMVRDGTITSEQMIEASRLKEGEIWEMAIERSADNRFAGDMTSFFLGAGIRPRTEGDMVIEKFWQDYGSMTASASMMTPEQYRQAWDKMRENPKYGMFVDALLLSRKSGEELDLAYTYNVLGRIPPGQMNVVAQAVGINPQMLQAFYDNKGDFEAMGLTPQDQKRFMAGVADIGAILAMPQNSTRTEWASARNRYNQMNEVLKQQFGEDILTLIEEMYDENNRSDYLELYPQVQAAMNYQTQYVLRDPVLNRYYGGIEGLQKYYRAQTNATLLKEFGQEMVGLAEEYNDPTISTERSKQLKKILKAYLERKSKLKQESLRNVTDFGRLLPEEPRPTARKDASPQGVSQNDLFELTRPALSAQQWEGIVGSPTMQVLADYLYGNEKIPYDVTRKLDWIAEREGFESGDDIMQQILQSLPQAQP